MNYLLLAIAFSAGFLVVPGLAFFAFVYPYSEISLSGPLWAFGAGVVTGFAALAAVAVLWARVWPRD
jgi:hypothetical protein